MLIISIIILAVISYMAGYYKGNEVGYNIAMKELLMERYNLKKKMTPVNIDKIKETK